MALFVIDFSRIDRVTCVTIDGIEATNGEAAELAAREHLRFPDLWDCVGIDHSKLEG